MKNQETPKNSRAARLTHVEADTSGARRWCPSARGAARAGVLTPCPGFLLSPTLPPPGQRRAPGPKPGHSGSLSPGKRVCGSGGQTEPSSEGLRGAGARPAPLLWPSCAPPTFLCRLQPLLSSPFAQIKPSLVGEVADSEHKSWFAWIQSTFSCCFGEGNHPCPGPFWRSELFSTRTVSLRQGRDTLRPSRMGANSTLLTFTHSHYLHAGHSLSV